MQIADFFSDQNELAIGKWGEGAACAFLSENLDKSPGDLLFVARDDKHLEHLRQNFKFFAPDLKPIIFPAWDCLPYDRVSPSRDLMGKRSYALSQLTSTTRSKKLILTTLNAIYQKLPLKSRFAGLARTLKKSEKVNFDEFTAYLSKLGYVRTETVREIGEFALRGGIMDVFLAGYKDPIRCDFFGNQLEGIKHFDALTQTGTEKLSSFTIYPLSELILTSSTISQFKQGYRELFGNKAAEKDPLYRKISEGQMHPGMEHWLPLFETEMTSLLSYLDQPMLVMAPETAPAIQARSEQIQEFYEARIQFMNMDADQIYNPLRADQLYFSDVEWNALLATYPRRWVHEKNVTEGITIENETIDFVTARVDPNQNIYEAFHDWVKTYKGRVVLAAQNSYSVERMGKILDEHEIKHHALKGKWAEVASASEKLILAEFPTSHSFIYKDVAFVVEEDLLGERVARKVKKRKSDTFLTEVSALELGDFVVHTEHGIGQFEGLETVSTMGVPHDCLRVIYQGGDRLFIPVENIEVLSKYGSEGGVALLDKLGGTGWQARKAKAKERIGEIAHYLIKLAAERERQQGEVMQAPEGTYDEFCAKFPYPETDDQLKAIDEITLDLASGKPMDRLVCGDVGFGKTEVAMRAAFQVALSGSQVVVVVPTTLLAMQHYKNFVARFEGFPVRIQQLSRFVPAKQAKQIKQEFTQGKIDILVGTHAVLSKEIRPPHLGLVIVDEEQHFGVAQKEKLKELKAKTHILTLTATPIPRTLQMALTGVRDLSLIATPPVDRMAIRTFIMPYDRVVIREALLREKYRGGQSFYVCPRLADIPKVSERLEKLVPEIKFAIAHGKLTGPQLEKLMVDFANGEYDVLISTNIVESGIDVASANTMILHRSDMFGLAQLYQLRGRVGRGKTRAYAYLTTPEGKKLTKNAEKRLHVMSTLDHLGAGFTLASHDLDIRGAGNLLGDEQSGHIKEVGIELYQNMLQEALANLKEGESAEPEWSPQINLGVPILIPESFVTDLSTRLGLYRRASGLKDKAEIDEFGKELLDRFGKVPREVHNLFDVLECKILCRKVGVDKIDVGPKGAIIGFYQNKVENPDKLIHFISQQKGRIKLRPDHKLVVVAAWESVEAKMQGVKKVLGALEKLSAPRI